MNKIKKIIWIINKDIEYQKEQLTGRFHKDKAIRWRIEGFELLLKKIYVLEEKEE